MRKFKGYQPVERNLDVSNPPKSGSGVSSDKVVVVIKLENEFTTKKLTKKSNKLDISRNSEMEKITMVCIKCGKILATSERRLEDAYFDSELRVRKLELVRQKRLSRKKDVIYAWCYKCYEEEKRKLIGDE